MFDHPQLAALNAILRTGSFEAAAAQLAVTQSAHHLPSTRGFAEAATFGIGWGLTPRAAGPRGTAAR